MVLASGFGLSACADLTGVDKLNSNDTTSTKDSVLPTAVIDTAGLTSLKVGDTIRVSVTDDAGVSSVRLTLLQGDTSAVWTSAVVSGARLKTGIVRVPLTGLSATFPYGVNLRLVAQVTDVNKRSRYQGASGNDTLKLSSATGLTARVGLGTLLSLPTGIFDDISFDLATRRLFFVSKDAMTGGAVDLVRFQRTPLRLETGSTPTHVLYRSTGLYGEPDLVVFNAGARKLEVFGIGDMTTANTRPSLTVSLPFGMLLDATEAATAPTPLLQTPSTNISSLKQVCSSAGCELWTGLVDRAASAATPGMFQRTNLSVGDPSQSFDIFSTLMVFPTDEPRNPLSGTDELLTLRAERTELTTGTAIPVWQRSSLSRCATLVDTSFVMENSRLSTGESVLYVKPALTTCPAILRLQWSGASWDVERAPAVQVLTDVRWKNVSSLRLIDGGRRIVAQTPDRVLISNPNLSIEGEIRLTGVTSFGGILEAPVSNVSAGRWMAVAIGREIRILDLATYRTIATLQASVAVAGNMWFLPTGVGDELLIVSRSTDKRQLVGLRTTATAIRGQ